LNNLLDSSAVLKYLDRQTEKVSATAKVTGEIVIVGRIHDFVWLFQGTSEILLAHLKQFKHTTCDSFSIEKPVERVSPRSINMAGPVPEAAGLCAQ
jgi:hypothetical protein